MRGSAGLYSLEGWSEGEEKSFKGGIERVPSGFRKLLKAEVNSHTGQHYG